jgi:hypothetical protein
MVIEGVNDQIVAVDDNVSVGEGQSTGNLWSQIIGNDVDPDGFWNQIVSIGTGGTQGVVTLDAYNQTVTYSAAGIDLAPGQTLVDSFTYVVDDDWGSKDTGTVFVTVTGSADGSASMAMTGGASLMGAFTPAGAGMADMPLWDMGQAQQILGADACIA